MDKITALLYWERYRVRLATIVFVTMGISGLIPSDLLIPVLAALWGKFPVFVCTALYMAVYVLGFCFSMIIILRYGGGNKFLEEYRFGRVLVRLLRHKEINHHHGWRWLLYELWYHLQMTVFGFIPLGIKFGLGRSALYPRFSAFAALILGTTIRVYLEVYLGTDFLHWLAKLFESQQP